MLGAVQDGITEGQLRMLGKGNIHYSGAVRLGVHGLGIYPFHPRKPSFL